MKRLFFIFITLILFISSCNELENQIQGEWVVDKAYYNEKPLVWNLYTNGFDLKEDNTCFLPVSESSHRHTEKETGTWSIIHKTGKTYIQISTTNELFNRTFKVVNLEKVRDTVSWGFLLKMTLTADSLKMDCTKAIYE